MHRNDYCCEAYYAVFDIKPLTTKFQSINMAEVYCLLRVSLLVHDNQYHPIVIM